MICPAAIVQRVERLGRQVLDRIEGAAARADLGHSWADVTTLEDPVRRLVCIHCRATKEEPR